MALGYAAHVTHHLAGYLDVPLKYPIRPANSRSAVKDHQLPVCLLSQGYAFSHHPTVGVPGRVVSIVLTYYRALEGQGAPDVPAPTQYQLYPDGTERTRFSYAVFLLNKVSFPPQGASKPRKPAYHALTRSCACRILNSS